MHSRHSHLPTVLQVGHDLIKADNFGSEKIQSRIDSIEDLWKNLLELANYRRRRLMEAVDFYQVNITFVRYFCSQKRVSQHTVYTDSNKNTLYRNMHTSKLHMLLIVGQCVKNK